MLTVCMAALSVSLVMAGQDAKLKDFTQVLPGEVQLTLVHLNDQTVPVLFQPPMLYAMRAHAKEVTMIYVQGTAERDLKLDTTNFVIEQNGETIPATPVSLHHFEKGNKTPVARGERFDGILEFAKLVNLSQPFTVKHGKDTVAFKFTANQLKSLAPAPSPQ
jgi:hypothetical protein